MFFEKSSLTCLPVPITIQVIRSQTVSSDSHSVLSDIYTASDPQISLLLQITTQQGKRLNKAAKVGGPVKWRDLEYIEMAKKIDPK